MTKQELYNRLSAAGIRLAPLENYTFKELSALMAPYHKQHPEPSVPQEQSEPVPEEELYLYFPHSFWCEAMQRSYRQGYYHTSDLQEYAILKKYEAKGETHE